MERKVREEELEHLFNRALQAENFLYEIRERGAHPNEIAQVERFYHFYDGRLQRAAEEWREQCEH